MESVRAPCPREMFFFGCGLLSWHLVRIHSAALRVAPAGKKDKSGLGGELDAAVEAMRSVPWTALAELKNDPDILKKIDDAEALLKSLRKTLSS